MRVPGWESRLSAAIDALRARPYEYGVHDCFVLTCAVVHALTGVDRWPEFAGKYTDRRSALATIAGYGATFEGAALRFFGCDAMHINQARRGDIAEVQINGLSHLGVVMGAWVFLAGEFGLVEYPRDKAARAWPVGDR